MRDRGIWHDMSQGPIERTGNPLDVAVDGNGFLVVQTPHGERYTRNGSMQINGNGQLVTSEGYPVLGDGGPITFQPTDRQVIDQPRRHDQRARRQFESRFGARQASAGHLRQSAATAERRQQHVQSRPAARQPQPATTTSRVVQGAIEKSNVRGVVEMSRMIEITRSYTQIATMLQQQTDLAQSAIDKLAEVPN